MPWRSDRRTIPIAMFVDNPGGRVAGTAGAVIRSRPMEDEMPRKYIDCRLFPSDSKCSVAISADTVDEVVDAATQHAVAVHKHEDSPQLRQQIRSSVKEGSPSP